MKLAAYFGRWFGGNRAPDTDVVQEGLPPRQPAAAGQSEAGSWLSEGHACYGRGELAEAARCFERALEAAHDLAPAHYCLGVLSAGQGHLEDALDRYLLAVSFAPQFAPAHRELGATLMRLGRLEEAAEACERACTLDPADPVNCFAAAAAAKARGEFETAVRHYRAALERNPDYLGALCNLGHVLDRLGRCGEALECYERALAIDPDFVEVIHNQGIVFRENGNLERALACFRRAIALRPDSADVHFNYALALLASGDLSQGWREYDYRFEQSTGASRRRPFTCPLWRDEDLTGKTLLVWGEQGIGDEILFSGMYDDLLGRGGRCVFECAAKLAPLLARSFPRALVVARTHPPHPGTQAVDYQIPAGSLGQYLRPTLASFPGRRGYLAADAARVERWRGRLDGLGPRLKVGFAWRSSDLQGKRALACTSLQQWGELFKVPGVTWVCLQYDECREELEHARRRFGVALHRFEEVDYFNDLDEVAALMKALDLLISAPTVVGIQGVAHGVEVWQMSYGADWQTHGTSAVPWHPSLVRFSRRWDQDWEEIIFRIAERLRERAAC